MPLLYMSTPSTQARKFVNAGPHNRAAQGKDKKQKMFRIFA